MNRRGILIISEDHASLNQIFSILDYTTTAKAHLTKLRKDDLSQLDLDNIGLVIFDIGVVTKTVLERALTVKKRCGDIGIIYICEHVDIYDYQTLAQMQRAAVVLRPFQEFELLGIVKKILDNTMIPKRSHPRYPTNYKAKVKPKSDSNQTEYGTRVKNLSQSGAFVHCSAEGFQVGDELRIEIDTEQGEPMVVDAIVRWTQDKVFWGPGQGLGIEFTEVLLKVPRQEATV